MVEARLQMTQEGVAILAAMEHADRPLREPTYSPSEQRYVDRLAEPIGQATATLDREFPWLVGVTMAPGDTP